MAATYRDIKVEQGANFKLTVTATEGGVVKNLTGYTASCHIRSFDLLSLYDDISAYMTIPTPSNGQILINIPASETEMYTFNVARYDVEVTNGSEVLRVQEGFVSLSPETTI